MAHGRRSAGFYVGAIFFALFVLFLYGPLSAIFVLSFQGPDGGLTFPMHGVSVRWFHALTWLLLATAAFLTGFKVLAQIAQPIALLSLLVYIIFMVTLFTSQPR